MGVAIGDDHEALAATVQRWVEARTVREVARAALDADDDWPSELWAELADLGWLGLAVSEASGGQGYGVSELVVVLEELGRGCLPGPFLSSVVAAVALDRWGRDPALVRRVVEGSATVGLALDSDLRLEGDRVSGTAATVWNGGTAQVLLLPVSSGTDGPESSTSTIWGVFDVAEVGLRGLPSFDRTRRLAEVTLDGAHLPEDRRLSPEAEVERLATLLAGAELLGVADWCVATASAYAAQRVQFGRPIGQFQAVKHRCADMLVALEMARAATWDGARALDEEWSGAAADAADGDGEPEAHPNGWTPGRLATDAAAALAPEAAFRCAKDCVQVLGGIGYTWEHDAHIFLKRATAMRHLLAPPATWRHRVARATAAGQRRSLAFELPPGAADAAEAAEARASVRALVAELADHDKSEWRTMLADRGYLTPHWPRPWGLDATPIQQLVIDEELAAAHVRRPHLAVAGWALPLSLIHI